MEMIRKQLEARHPRAMLSRAEKSMHHRAARAIRQWLIVFILLTAGAATANAGAGTIDQGTVVVNGVRYHLYYSYNVPDGWSSGKSYYYYDAYVEAFVGYQTEVTILSSVQNGSSIYNVKGLRYDYITRERTATIASTSVRRINFEGNPSFNGEAGNPTFNCPNLQEVYFLGGTPSFSGNWSDIFGSHPTNTVTAYVKGKTQAQCVELKTNNAVWSGFKAVKAYQDTYTCTMGSNGSGEVFIVKLGGNCSSFADPNAPMLAKSLYIAKGSSVTKYANLYVGQNYAVVYVASVATKIPTLKRNGTEVPLTYVTYGNNKYAFYNETNLQENVNYQWSHTFNTVSVTLANETNGTVFISDLGSYSSFENNGAQNRPHLIDLNGKGSRTTARVKDGNYATVYVNSDPTKIPKLKIRQNSGNIIFPDQTPTTITHNGVEYAYYNLPTPTYIHFSYTWTTIDKQCSVSFTQKQLPNNTAKTGTVNVKNGSTQQSFNTATKTYSFSQGSTMELDIPFDPAVQTLSSINVGGTNILPQAENGHYKATIPVPLSNSLAVELIWNEPIPEPEPQPDPGQPVVQPKQPKAMVIRTGEGSVTFKGRGNLEVGQDDYEWRDLVTMNCSDPTSTVTIPNLDMRDQILDDEDWGFRIEIKPADGEVLRNLMIGGIDKDNLILTWDNYVNNSAYSNYLNYDEATGTYVFEALGDYMNFPKGDYTILVDMGPETVTAENSKTFNFVRKGGEGQAFIYWEDQMRDFYFNEDGSYSVEIPNEQLTDAQMYIDIQKGETFRVFKDGEDITTQFQNNWSGDYGEYGAELETASATYTILIEKENVEAVQTIPFADEVVKQICVENWDTDGDGELSFVEAQNVTSLGGVFADTRIETFDELKFFTGLTEIGNEEFSLCDELKKITLPPTITSIGASAFQQCLSLQTIELPAALVEIGEYVFFASGLKEIYIPANVLTINGQAFAECDLEMIIIDNENPVFESGIYRNAVIEKETQTVRVLCDNALIPEGVSSIGESSWVGKESRTQLVVPASVEEIGMYTFNPYLETLTMKRREPIAFNVDFFGGTSAIPANCQLIVPFGTRDAYIAAGWTEDIFKGGVVEDESVLDVNGDGVVDTQDARSIIDKYLD